MIPYGVTRSFPVRSFKVGHQHRLLYSHTAMQLHSTGPVCLYFLAVLSCTIICGIVNMWHLINLDSAEKVTSEGAILKQNCCSLSLQFDLKMFSDPVVVINTCLILGY